MITRSSRSFFYGVSALTLAAISSTSAFAQDADASGSSKGLVLDTLVITGEKVARDIKNTASSVTVITAKEIDKEKTGDTSVSEAVRGTPNVVYTDTVGAPVIRGQDTQGPNNGATAFFSGTVPRATINLDGHYLNYNEFIFGSTSIWDLDSIEVFCGPQTTSQGANAIAGAIVVNTKDPTFEQEGAYQVEIGSYKSKRTSIMLNSPLYKDELAGRLAIDYSGRDTFIDYVNPGFYSSGTDQDFQSLNIRSKLLWQPAEIPALRRSSPTLSTRAIAQPMKRPRRLTMISITVAPPCRRGISVPIPASWMSATNLITASNSTTRHSSQIQRSSAE